MGKSMLMLILAMSSVAGATTALEVAGFSKGQEDESKRTYVFRGETEYTISKTSFTQRSDAEKFCHDQGSHLASFVDVMVVAMSGAGRADSNLQDAVYFKPKGADAGVLLAWTETPTADGTDVETMMDGRGTDTETGKFSDIQAGLLEQGISLGLKAVCTRSVQAPR